MDSSLVSSRSILRQNKHFVPFPGKVDRESLTSGDIFYVAEHFLPLGISSLHNDRFCLPVYITREIIHPLDFPALDHGFSDERGLTLRMGHNRRIFWIPLNPVMLLKRPEKLGIIPVLYRTRSCFQREVGCRIEDHLPFIDLYPFKDMSVSPEDQVGSG